MSILIKEAKSSSELNQILSLRYQQLRKHGNISQTQADTIDKFVDYLDIFPETLNLLASQNGQAIATLRAVRPNSEEKIFQLVYNFSESIKNMQGLCYLIDLFTLTDKTQNTFFLMRGLIKSALFYLSQRGVQNVFINSPEEFDGLLTEMNFKKISETFYSEALNQKVSPYVISIQEFEKKWQEETLDKEILRFRDIFYITLFESGDLLTIQGEKGQTAHLIHEGEVEVLLSQNDNLMPIAELKKGQLIGELAMITREPRTASLVAKNPTICLSFDRSDFLKLLYSEPHRSLDLFKICSKRLENSNKRIASLKEAK